VVSARLRDLYQTTHNIHKGQTSNLPLPAEFIGFEPLVLESERPRIIFVMDTVALGFRFLLVLVFLCQYQSVSALYSCVMYYWCCKIL